MTWKVTDASTGKTIKTGFDNEEDAYDWLQENANKLIDSIYDVEEVDEEEEEVEEVEDD